jgi:hypothetical protein
MIFLKRRFDSRLFQKGLRLQQARWGFGLKKRNAQQEESEEWPCHADDLSGIPAVGN